MKNKAVAPCQIAVSNEDAKQFIQTLRDSSSTLSSEYIERILENIEHNAAFAVSFNAQWRPFWSYKFGYSENQDRKYIDPPPLFLKRVRDCLKSVHRNSPSGGKVFIRKNFTSIKIKDGTEQKLCIYTWPSGDPVKQIIEMLSKQTRSR